MAVLDQGVVQVTVEARFNRGHVFQLGKVPHRDLLLAVAWARWCGHLVYSLTLPVHSVNSETAVKKRRCPCCTVNPWP